MKELQSNYIVKLHDSQDTKDYMYIILEYCNGGDLKKDMSKQPNKIYSLRETARILSDVVRGLECVHAKGFLHRDIKIDNILVNEEKGTKVPTAPLRSTRWPTSD
jgi:serine/threonine protein kinase